MTGSASIFTLRARTRTIEAGRTSPTPGYVSSHAEEVRAAVRAAREPGADVDETNLRLVGELELWLRGHDRDGATAGS